MVTLTGQTFQVIAGPQHPAVNSHVLFWAELVRLRKVGLRHHQSRKRTLVVGTVYAEKARRLLIRDLNEQPQEVRATQGRIEKGRPSSKTSLRDKRGRHVLPVRLIGRDNENTFRTSQANVE